LLDASSLTTSPISSAPSPQVQREAPVLQYWHGRTPAKIGRHLDRTPAAAAGLLKRGLKKLRQELQADH
jgi:DNA-directed RNA polymerase specialized sigma24 family protein